MNALNLMACAVIFAWAVWAVLNKNVRDGIVGKVIFCCIAFSAMSVMFSDAAVLDLNGKPATALHLSIAALGLRHVCIKHFWAYAIRKYICMACPFNERRHTFKRRKGDQ